VGRLDSDIYIYIYLQATAAGCGTEILGEPSKKSRLQEPYSPINDVSAAPQQTPSRISQPRHDIVLPVYPLSFNSTGANGALVLRARRSESVWYGTVALAVVVPGFILLTILTATHGGSETLPDSTAPSVHSVESARQFRTIYVRLLPVEHLLLVQTEFQGSRNPAAGRLDCSGRSYVRLLPAKSTFHTAWVETRRCLQHLTSSKAVVLCMLQWRSSGVVGCCQLCVLRSYNSGIISTKRKVVKLGQPVRNRCSLKWRHTRRVGQSGVGVGHVPEWSSPNGMNNKDSSK